MVKRQASYQFKEQAVRKEIRELTHKIRRAKNPQEKQKLQDRLEMKESALEEILSNI